jgi:hypothetical protein
MNNNNYYYLFKLQMGFYPVAVVQLDTKTIRRNTQIRHHTPKNKAHKTQTIKDTLHTMNSIQLQQQLNK